MVKKLFDNGDKSFLESETALFWQAYYALGMNAKDNSFRLVLTINLSQAGPEGRLLRTWTNYRGFTSSKR
jgi:hypothetical protein